MARVSKMADRYVNRAYATVTMSAANTLTFAQIRWAVGTFTGIALRVNKIEWFPSTASLRELVAATDSMFLALTGRQDLTNLDPTNQSVYARHGLIGIGANVEVQKTPMITDFSTLPENAILLPPNPMYVGMNTAGFAAAGACNVIIYYQFIKLSDREALEVLQTIIPGNV